MEQKRIADEKEAETQKGLDEQNRIAEQKRREKEKPYHERQAATIKLLDGISKEIAPIKSWPVLSFGYSDERYKVFDQLFNGLTEQQIFEFAEKLNISYTRNDNMQSTNSILMDDELATSCIHFSIDDGYGGHNDVDCKKGHTKHKRWELPCKGCPDINVNQKRNPKAFLRGRVIDTLMKAKDEQLYAEKRIADERKKKQEAEAEKLLAQLNRPVLETNKSIVEQCKKLQTTVKEYKGKTLAEIYELTQGRSH
jgi:hypothetical protein